MPIYQLENIPEEFVTPKHSTAYGRLITGTQVEVGLLRYKAGEGAKQHAHPHEQVLLVLKGKCRLTLDATPTRAMVCALMNQCLEGHSRSHPPPEDRSCRSTRLCVSRLLSWRS